MLNPLLCVKVDCRKPQSIVKRDLRPPAGSSGFGNIELQGTNDTVTCLRAPADLKQCIQYRNWCGQEARGNAHRSGQSPDEFRRRDLLLVSDEKNVKISFGAR
jgi:hypothetical protein